MKRPRVPLWIGIATVFLIPQSCVPSATAGAARYFPDPSNYGWSHCVNDEPVAWINIRIIGTPDEATTVAHELMHGKQMRRQGTCVQYAAWLSVHRAEAEAEAFCEEVMLETRPPYSLTLGAAKVKYANWLSRGYPQFNLTPADALGLLNGFC